VHKMIRECTYLFTQ